MSRILLPLLLVALSWASLAAANALPEPFELRYEVLRNGKPQGQARLSLEAEGADRWVLRMVVEADRGLAGLIGFREEERSELQVDATGELRVLSYERRRDSGLRKRSERIRFDWSAGQAEIDLDGERSRQPLQPGLSDPNSVALRMAADLMAGRSPGPYTVLRRGRIDDWRFRQAGHERMGQREVVVIERIRDHDRRRTTSWLAPELGYLPVRMEQVEDGETLMMRLLP